jgi:hypothetical protein
MLTGPLAELVIRALLTGSVGWKFPCLELAEPRG